MDDNTFKLLLAALGTLQVIALAYLGVQQKTTGSQANVNAMMAHSAAERVESKLADTTGQTTEKLDTIHTLVNSRLSEALAKIDRLEAKLYDVTGETPSGETPSGRS
jgi:Tol biopolymer transport system component